MVKKLLRTSVLFLLFFSVISAHSQVMSSIESVEYDAVNHRFLVSNGSNIIVVGSDGNEIEYFGSEPEADYGMEIMGTALYAIVGSGVKAYDLTSGLEVSSITITGAQFLNGMASDNDHRIWVSDFNAKTIYEIDFTNLSSPTYVQIVANTVTTPNGICYDQDNDRLVFVNWGSSAKIKAISLSDYSVTTLVNNSGVANIDGIDNDNYGNYFISSWTPNRITKYNSDFSVSEIITVAGGVSSPADIAYAEEIDTLVIPNTNNQTVRFVGFSTESVDTSPENPFAFTCYPNPLTDKSVLSFRLQCPSVTKIEVLDAQGRLVLQVLEENLPATLHKIVLGDLDLSPGNYIWRIESGEISFMQAFIK